MLQQYLRLLDEPFEILKKADRLREEAVGDEVTYVINRNINFTDICVNNCKFCSFSNRKKYTLTFDEIKTKVQEAVYHGCTEVCIQGGLIPGAGLEYYINILNAVREVSEEIHIHAFSPMEIYHISKNSNMNFEDVIGELKEAGLDSIPGTAAEILDDEIRKQICPQKITTEEWVEIIKTAHNQGIPTTATMMYGHIESWEDRINHLSVIKKIQQHTGGFTEFIPLPFMWKNNELGKIAKGSSGFDDLLVIAISRIILYPEIINIQASWVKLGTKLVQAALYTGANDIGGTLIEENISKLAGSTSGEFLSVGDLKDIISRAGRIPKQRDTLYRIFD